MKELLTYLVKSLVDKPEEVRLDSSDEAGTVRFRLKVADSDKGKVIGREGKVIKAIRTLLSSSAEKDNRRVFLDVE
ncbi:MAG: KH domain-containing protein [bacterium]